MKTVAVQDARMREIDTLVTWEGEIGNARVRQLYDLSIVRASQLIAQYRKLNPKGLVHDTKARVYRRSNAFRPRFRPQTMDDYDQLIAAHTPPFIVDGRPEFTHIRPELFAHLYRACADVGALAIRYRSMRHPEGLERVIRPTNMVRVGRRWHVRAWCYLRMDYRDFALGRMVDARSVPLPSEPPQLDHDWDRVVELVIGAHRAMSPGQQAVINAEYFDGAETRRLRVRRCLAKYVVQDLRAAVDPKRQAPPEYQLEVRNASAHAKLFLGLDDEGAPIG